ncbi:MULTISPECIES: hypothetical protein [unclassified Microcoleus]
MQQTTTRLADRPIAPPVYRSKYSAAPNPQISLAESTTNVIRLKLVSK